MREVRYCLTLNTLVFIGQFQEIARKKLTTGRKIRTSGAQTSFILPKCALKLLIYIVFEKSLDFLCRVKKFFYFLRKRRIRLDVSQRPPPIPCTSP